MQPIPLTPPTPLLFIYSYQYITSDSLSGSNHGLLSSFNIDDDELCFLDLTTASDAPLGVPVTQTFTTLSL